MNICLIGDGLTSLTLAKNLINKNIEVFLYYKNNKKPKFQSRTIGISKNNFDFFNKEINRNIDKIKIRAPNNSISLLATKFDVFSNIFFISIKMNQINNFVSFNK